MLKCFDHKRKEYVALKIIRNKKRFHRQAVVEVRVLETLKRNDPEDNKNTIKMKEWKVTIKWMRDSSLEYLKDIL